MYRIIIALYGRQCMANACTALLFNKATFDNRQLWTDEWLPISYVPFI